VPRFELLDPAEASGERDRLRRRGRGRVDRLADRPAGAGIGLACERHLSPFE
jgi:hypothetical protein